MLSYVRLYPTDANAPDFLFEAGRFTNAVNVPKAWKPGTHYWGIPNYSSHTASVSRGYNTLPYK
jgi:hypothetical protein